MLYELRTYTVQPDKMPELLHLWEHVGKPIVDRYMRCVGIWTAESGVINRIIHLYVWENHAERDQKRAEFYALPESKAYVAKVKPLYQLQECTFMSAVSFSPPFPKG